MCLFYFFTDSAPTNVSACCCRETSSPDGKMAPQITAWSCRPRPLDIFRRLNSFFRVQQVKNTRSGTAGLSGDAESSDLCDTRVKIFSLGSASPLCLAPPPHPQLCTGVWSCFLMSSGTSDVVTAPPPTGCRAHGSEGCSLFKASNVSVTTSRLKNVLRRETAEHIATRTPRPCFCLLLLFVAGAVEQRAADVSLSEGVKLLPAFCGSSQLSGLSA